MLVGTTMRHVHYADRRSLPVMKGLLVAADCHHLAVLSDLTAARCRRGSLLCACKAWLPYKCWP